MFMVWMGGLPALLHIETVSSGPGLRGIQRGQATLPNLLSIPETKGLAEL